MTPVNFLRQRIPGPEQDLEDLVLAAWNGLFEADEEQWAALGSAQVGAGYPDLTFGAFPPHLLSLSPNVEFAPSILGYLRTVAYARTETVVSRTGISKEGVEDSISQLLQWGAVTWRDRSVRLTNEWRSMMPDVVAVEVKVSNWREAITQAVRNTIFSTRSFVALPSQVADRARSDPRIAHFGVGIISIDAAGDVSVLRRTRRRPPRVWSYYYGFALKLIESQQEH